MTPFLTIVFGVLFGVAATCLAILWTSSSNDYMAAVLPGQRRKVKGLGIITIKETLSGGKYYQKFGSGTNVAYITERGAIGHCSRYAITHNGTLVKKMTNVSFVSSDIESDDGPLRTYNSRGRIVKDRPRDTIDAEFCDVKNSGDNVYHLIPKQRKR